MGLPIYVKRLYPDAELPYKNHKGDACFDLYAGQNTVIRGFDVTKIHTGIAIQMPRGYEGVIRPRSSSFVKKGIQVHIGTIDNQYRGEIVICASMINPSDEYMVEAGESIAQIKFQKVEEFDIIGVEDLSDTERGIGGFGSTG